MRVLSVLALLALSGFSATGVLGGSPMAPDTPSEGATSYSSLCVLDKLTFSNGLTLTTTFAPNKFKYTCTSTSSAWKLKGYSTVVYPHLVDNGSTAEITFNGKEINFRTNSPGNGISNLGVAGGVPNSPNTQSDSLTFIDGQTNTIIVGAGCNKRNQPTPCYYQYTITCDKPKPGTSVIGDPQFVGLRGQSYQVHGVAGEVYNIVSDADLQYNSKFVFLSKGECPVVAGIKQKGCFSHPGSYLGELGLKTRAGDKIHLATGNAQTGFTAVEVNGKALAVGDTVILADNMGSVSMNSTHVASVQVANWDFVFENSDMFVNQKVRVLDSRSLRSHGLLGQTWRDTTYPNAVKHIQGTVDDYVVRKKDLFGDDFIFNHFN